MIKRIGIILSLLIVILAFSYWLDYEIKNIKLPEIKKEEISVTPTQSDREKVVVSRVIDGDTVELSDKRKVRYIGINSPEMTDKRPEVKCLAQKAKEANIQLVEGKEVELEKDVSETDKYGRLLRYVWVDGQMVNEMLMSEGWTQVMTYPPDVKYQEMFVESEKTAKMDKLGIWGEICK